MRIAAIAARAAERAESVHESPEEEAARIAETLAAARIADAQAQVRYGLGERVLQGGSIGL